ncbi:von Willebrand factor A domain-containing protein 8 [Scaptodrosophila lebanonensis]|uniref:von Willebrand factor A domain-containing protein 8 n=1 Tax=Drosophila lebanonensis TaxID=7225 RepID=A0A6J2TUB0_DROLE|nr:von Willebrand factor A domain-containing protein 8 [Scaptodrosophila lebanonensis]
MNTNAVSYKFRHPLPHCKMLANLQSRAGYLLRHHHKYGQLQHNVRAAAAAATSSASTSTTSWRRSYATAAKDKAEPAVAAAAADEQLTIGDVTVRLTKPRQPELVPQQYVHYAADGTLQFTQSALHHLRWMLQKDALKQDMFLLGQPGPLRRQLALQFLELTQRELEYIALSRDTTESDLKQRREIKDRAAIYHDQCAVRAALHGRVLVLDGVEHAERNVLPILNNLLENREMHLENGKFLMAPERYDKLLETHSKAQLDEWGLLRVSENFRVVALGLPTQKYKGTPLDPPLRSRFQSRNIAHYSYDELLLQLQRQAPQAPLEALKGLLSFALTVQTTDATLNLPDFPLDSLRLGAQMLQNNPSLSVHDVISRLYPYESMLKHEQKQRIKELFKSLKVDTVASKSVQRIDSQLATAGEKVDFQLDDVKLTLPAGSAKSAANAPNDFIDLTHQRNVLASLIQSYAVGDVCLIGERGVGKLTLTKQLLRLLQQSAEPMMLYEDMTSRDLVQQRITSVEGDTVWRDSPLVRAAKTGSVAILNGIHRLHKSTASVLQRLVHDRELQLCDGTTLLREDRYQALLKQGLTKLELAERGILPISESFRIVALAEPPKPNVPQQNWLTPELLSLFLYQEVRPLQQSEEYEIIQQLHGGGKMHEDMHKVIELAHILRASKDPLLESMAGTLSTRQLLKIARRMAAYPPNENSSNYGSVHDIVQNTFLAKFMPALSRAALEQAIKDAGIRQPPANQKVRKQISVESDTLRIGNTELKLEATTEAQQSKVPSTLFYEMPQHVELLERLLQDFIIGDHLLLVGNQGVGKNKLIDKLLELMRKPREYLQLHRDTTVHSLTVQSTLRDGQVIYEDSALVKAVKAGHVLVIDEADKAPVNVTCILRTLVESGEMVLSDGRKIVPAGSDTHLDAGQLIETHPNFRIIVLANRPGFPFLGNDFFASLGDVFSCHAIDNPTPDSEIYLLQQYGPSVPTQTLRTLVNAFGELRSLADEGLLNYPYSTREVVSIVKHLERYPDESMSELVGNVLDFDKYQPEALEQVTQVLAKHGLPIEAYAKNELYALRKKKELQLTVQRHSGLGVSGPKYGKTDPKNDPHVGGNTWAGGSGGRDTAGLGGKGGPFRLDKGHKVHQLSDEEKNDIPEEIKKAAREMNRKAFEEKLKEIKMSAHDHRLYAQFSEPNRKQVQQLKAVLDAMQTKSKERQWQKYQTHGELDDTRLIEGITGEKNIYRRRAEANPWADHVQEKPNRLKLVVDVSGSMYRFNGYDGRLDRELEAVVMVMEAFESYEKKIVYDVVGHSGEGWEIPFVNVGSAPKNDKERFEAIRLMHAHSQFCWSGDSTVKATREAVNTLGAEDEYDNSIVVVLSDANLSRYGIAPKDLALALKRGEPKVKGYVIFIGSLAEEADEINAQMPAGHSFVCMDLTKLPQILKQIFTSSLL